MIFRVCFPGQQYGDLQRFERLSKLDLSSNLLHSVEKGAFTNLPSRLSMELHDNPWNCDCNLQYLKRWLTDTKFVVTSSEANIQCSTPSVFSGVTINSIDLEALRCSPRYEYSFLVLFVSFQSLFISFLTSMILLADFMSIDTTPRAEKITEWAHFIINLFFVGH